MSGNNTRSPVDVREDPARASRRPSWLLVPAAMAIVAMSLTVHVVMLQVLQVPYPALDGIGRWGLVLVTMRVLALIILYRLAGPSLTHIPLLARIALIAVLDTMIAGNLRSAIMASVVTADVTFPAIGFLVRLVQSLILALLVVGSRPVAQRPAAALLMAVAITAAMTFAVDPVGRAVLAPFAHLQGIEIYKQPYGIYVLSWSYLSFVEPVAAVLAIAALVEKRLSSRPRLSLVQFAILILLLRGTLVMQLLFPWVMRGDFASSALSTSQFFLQDLMMAVSAWLTWRSRIGVPRAS